MGDFFKIPPQQIAGAGQAYVNPVEIKTGGGSYTGGETQRAGENPLMQQIAQVSDIGFGKKAGYENGLGGTNTPVDANGRLCQTWIA